MQFLYDKKVIVKRYASSLGEYNRPIKELETIGTYECHTAETSTSTSQKEPQKDNITDLDLYTYPDTPIERGDVLYIYEVDEYDEIIPATELKAVADKPYKKRTQLKVPLISDKEV